MKSNVALVIIFNHRFDRNIQVLEKMYEGRFSNIYFLVPFYNGDHPRVIPVYENSFYFHGYIAQAFKQIFNESFHHYFYLADDMLLNPEINEHNYKDHFNLTDDTAFIPEVFSLNNFSNNDTLLFNPYIRLRDKLLFRSAVENSSSAKKLWWRMSQAFRYSPFKEGVESANEIPSYEEALPLITRHGIEVTPLTYIDVHGGCPPPRSIHFFRYLVKHKLLKKKYRLKYPLVASYADIVIVPATSIKSFVHYCGVFAATELFVEFAIPTALLMSCEKVLSEPAINKRGLIYWVYNDEQKARYDEDMSKYGYKIENLMKDFPKDKLYIHPVKLSKWKTDSQQVNS
jgi:hypothetical protein